MWSLHQSKGVPSSVGRGVSAAPRCFSYNAAAAIWPHCNLIICSALLLMMKLLVEVKLCPEDGATEKARTKGSTEKMVNQLII